MPMPNTSKEPPCRAAFPCREAPLALLLAPLLMQCVSPQVESRLQKLEAKQDSLLKMLSTMKEQSEFVAYPGGLAPPGGYHPQGHPPGQLARPRGRRTPS